MSYYTSLIGFILILVSIGLNVISGFAEYEGRLNKATALSKIANASIILALAIVLLGGVYYVS